MNKIYDNHRDYASLILALAGSVASWKRRMGMSKRNIEVLNNSLIDFKSLIMWRFYVQ